ncbi:MarR family winged helix-turn-helix transcriptional regulator [Egicoccus sp. AB-alg6-2]|uniref:MarR family winged helix-turn-helix transcriptional regulator n=1 Tax=Egicoccus sp. AB-alg6-2 TaxID=3242692 RepID=UPI00359E237E
MAEPRWLTDDEQRAWRGLVSVVLRLPGALESQLQREADLSHFEYWVLALLSEADGRARRMRDLAQLANGSLSRLSHVVTRLERRGFVAREPAPDDARSTLAVLTDAGYAQVVATAPGHVATVRALVFDALAGRDVADLERICDALVASLDAHTGPRAG